MNTQQVKSMAEEMFFTLKEKLTTYDPQYVGGCKTETIEIDGIKYELRIDGKWHKKDWFEYQLTDMSDELVSEGTVLL